jgi:hypothetical protein
MALSRKNKRRKQRAINALLPSKMIFTFAAIHMLKDALRLVDEAFSRNTKPLPNLELGRETLESLKQKLDEMLQSEERDEETPFDYNELHILYAAIHMYLVDLTLDGNQQLMPTCLQLCKQFSAVIETLPPKQQKAARE